VSPGPSRGVRCSRREFLNRLLASVGLAAGSGGLGMWFHNRRLVPTPSGVHDVPSFSVDANASTLVSVHGDDSARMVQVALGALGGIQQFVQPGDRVLVKPNCAFDRPPHLGATTSPGVVAEVVRQCRQAGASVRVIDNPINNAAGCFEKSGIRAAVDAAGGTVWLPDATMFARARIGRLRIASWDALYEPLRWASKVIGIPTAKTHNLCHASLAMKNWYGLLGSGRNRLHQAIDDVIADLGLFIKPTLVVLDATRLLMRNGPTGGSPADVKPGHTIAMGTDQVAIDAYGAHLLGFSPGDIAYLGKAEALGLGKCDWKELSGFREITVS